MSCCQRLPTTSLSVTENRHHTMMTLGTRPLTGSAATLFALALLTQLAGTVAAPNPLPTASPTKVQPQKRGISSWASSVAQGLPTDVASGVLPAFQGLPNADEVKQQLNLTDDDINRLPQSVLNIPSYANWTGQGWNMRIHGVAYKQPQATDEQLDQISSVFISDLETSSLNDTERRQSRNMSALMIAAIASFSSFQIKRMTEGNLTSLSNWLAKFQTTIRSLVGPSLRLGSMMEIPACGSSLQRESQFYPI